MANKIREFNVEDTADKVAISAIRVAIVAGVVALGAAFIAGPKTQNKITQETNSMMDSMRGIINFFRSNLDNTKRLDK